MFGAGLYISSFVSLLSIMTDEIILWLHDALTNNVFGIDNNFVIIVGTIILGALAWNIVNVVTYWVNKGHVAWDCIHKIVLATLCIVVMRSAIPLSKEQAWMPGVSYADITAPVSDTALDNTIRGIKMVDVVASWNSSLSEARKAKVDRILQTMANTDPDMMQAYQNRLKERTGAKQEGLLAAFKRVGDTIMNLGHVALTLAPGDVAITDLAISFVKAEVLALAHMVGGFMLSIAYFGMAIAAIRTVLILALALKIGVWLTLYILPGTLGLLYFPSLRPWAISICKNILLMSLMCTLLTSMTGIIFSQKNVEKYVALAMKETPIGSRATTITKSDILMLQITSELRTADMGEVTPSDASFWVGFSLSDLIESGMAVWRVLIIMALLMGLIVKTFDAMVGTLDGSWDVIREQSGVRL